MSLTPRLILYGRQTVLPQNVTKIFQHCNLAVIPINIGKTVRSRLYSSVFFYQWTREENHEITCFAYCSSGIFSVDDSNIGFVMFGFQNDRLSSSGTDVSRSVNS